MYFVGTYEDYCCFPSIDRQNRICRAKLIRFNQTTGKRLKKEDNGRTDNTSSLPSKLKLKENFQYKQIFFGEHLLSKCPNKPVAVVEAEKTAIIATLCLPEVVWLATGSKQSLKTERIKLIGQRAIILYPDVDGYEKWRNVAAEARQRGLTVEVSDLIEHNATDEDRAAQVDLADYLINKQREINQHNFYVDKYNAAVDRILQDERLMNEASASDSVWLDQTVRNIVSTITKS